MYDSEGNLFFALEPDEAKDPKDVRPEIDRVVLRKILLDAVPTDSIKWGHELTSVCDLGYRERELTLANSTTVTLDILVGAPIRASILSSLA